MGLNLEDEVFKRLINHVFLPRKLPGKESETLVQDESELLSAFTNVISTSDYRSTTPVSTSTLFTTWDSIQGIHLPTEDNISNGLRNQKKGNMFGYYVRAQNCGIFIHFDSNDATFSTFPVSLKSDVIMSNWEGEVIAAFPEQSIKIPKSDLLKSKALARQIVILTNHPMLKALSMSKKAGSECPEGREVPDTIYISEWLASVLSDATSKTATDHQKFCKKIKDHIVWENSLAPFRRSGMWMTIKVNLQLSLCQSALGPEVGKALYKILMAEFMRQMCERAKTSAVNSDIGMFMIKKLARRVRKVLALPGAKNLGQIVDTFLNKTSNTCDEYKKIMVTAWKKQIKIHSIVLPKLQINHLHIYHQKLPEIPKLNGLAGSQGKGLPDPPKCISRINLSELTFPDIPGLIKTIGSENSEEIGKLLFDTESWIFRNMDRYSDCPPAVTHIRRLADNYIRRARGHYNENPLRTSRMILAFLKMVQILDHIAMSSYPMLKEHFAGVDPIVIQNLLLPLKSELKLAHELEVYFQERNAKARFPALTGEDSISANSFSVRYAMGNQEMLDLRDKILVDAENEILGKKGEVKHAKKVCEGLKAKLGGCRCTCNGVCAYHTTSDILKEQSVDVYERPLRNEDANQLAVVFELLIPPEIACLRDIITLLTSRVCQASKKQYSIEGRIWTNYDKIRKYTKNMEIQNFYKLGSTSKLFVDSHYRSLHPDQPELSFIVNNGYNCTFEGSYFQSWNVKKWTTLKVNPASPYKDLQWTLETTNHTQNQVFARQVECPGELRLVEFKEFGSLRAGHRIQLRNILRALIENSLSLKEESVFSLICQSVWEAGPPGANWNGRESHEDLAKEDFSSKWIQELDKQLDMYQNNWTEAYTLLAIIVLTSRALEFGQVTTQAAELLLKCRNTAYEWIARIEDMITKSVDDSAEQVQELRLKLLDAAICLCLTYSVDFEYIGVVLNSGKDLFLWMHGLTRIRNITASTITTLSSLRNILINLIHSKIILTMESKLMDFVGTGLNVFVKENWKDGSNGNFDEWTSLPAPAVHIYETNFQRGMNEGIVHLQVDLHRGSFLVNGLPVGYLPENITQHSGYKRVFKNIVFEVQPGVEDRTFVTSHRYEGADYRFTLLTDDKTLIIRERKNEEEFQLIPWQNFGIRFGIIPHLLIRDYSHWLNVGKQWIDFRPVSFNDFDKQKVKFRLSLVTRELVELSTGNRLFYVASSTHLSTTNYLKTLENSCYIHTILTSENRIEVHLPRMRLRFRIDENTLHMENLEYGMSVRPDQSFGSLIGLRNGLLLENKENEQQKLLIPNGLVEVLSVKNPNDHHGVRINLVALNNPTVFTLDLDDRLKQLRAGKSTLGWFYLAHLHAVTSSPLADPFTGVTGTEEAFRILQSGHCWSCKPFEDQQIREILQAIKRLSPVRQYYPSHLKRMETIRWPSGIPSCAAHDGFRFIVDKLISDSERLRELFQKGNGVEEEEREANVPELSKRAYISYEPLCPEEGKICEEFLNILPAAPSCTIGIDSRAWITRQDYVSNTRVIAESGHSWHYKPPYTQPSLTNFLITRDELRGRTDPEALANMSIIELLEFDFRNNWIDLFELARLVMKEDLKSEWTTLLSILAFTGQVNLDHLLILQGVAVHRVFFQAQDPSKLVEKFKAPDEKFNDATIRRIFANHHIKNIDVLTSLVKVLWPIKSLSVDNFEDLRETYLSNALPTLNQHLKLWKHNLDLFDFVQKVEKTIAVLPRVTCRDLNSISLVSSDGLLKSFGQKPKFKLVFNDMIQAMIIADKISRIYQEGFLSSGDSSVNESTSEGQDLYNCFMDQREFYRTYSSSVLKDIEQCLIHTQTRGLYHADIFRVTPSALLSRLRPSNRPAIAIGTPDEAKPVFNDLIGALGVLWTLEQRAFRCMKYFSLGDPGIVMLTRERENRGHINWSPAEFPDWLLFEIESDLMIRPVQIDVTNQMMNPPEEKHSVMQLNMGEGKTAVIVPLLALALANKKQVFRVTVLKSLFKTNASSLVASLGGLLKRRIYMFPCQRDLEISAGTTERMLEVYKECRDKSGIVITLPEHRLSFQLKGYEKCRAKDTLTGEWLFYLRNWLSANVRDVLDESDEILYVKYQLIYTLGSQLPVDGGMMRWGIAQSLLKLLPARMADLQVKFGDSFVDTSETLRAKSPEIFHHTRLLKKECYGQLIEWLAEDILDRKSIGIKVPDVTSRNKNLLKNLLINTEIDKDSHERALKLLTPTQTTSILMLMGYLKYEILYLCLTKRWRVSYGVDVEGERKMAVPFKAKDIPSKRTEFGHPDVAIMLTQLSYYYSGLSNEELEQTFERLNFVPNKEQEYAGWIRQIPSEHVDPSITQLSGVNLVDLKQKYELLFPVLKRNMAVIDFWLGHVVFPSESRVFEKKLVCTPWDLVSEDFQLPITGFSGTNDSTVLLPAPISQQDLPQLQSTNEDMKATILLEENNNLEILQRGTSGEEILRKLIEKDIPVLLDAGALMLELDNEGVARTWLELLGASGTREAAVYYDDDNELRVKHRDYLDESSPFHSSSYVDQLQKCVVYLDDVHTRGTDLRIPPPSRACVTLCAGITRDKMIQACMRMRLLGKGHTLQFFANDEAANGMSTPEFTGTLGSAHVMDWVCNNSRQFEKDGLVYWASSGLNYAHKRLVEANFRKTQKTQQNWVSLGELCCDQEFQTLEVMYGQHREELQFMAVLQSQVDRKRTDLVDELGVFVETPSLGLFDFVRESIIERCKEYIADKKVVSYLLDEEHEKEHEEEPEEQREVIRPPPAKPAQHILSSKVIHFMQTGDTQPGLRSGAIMKLKKGFIHTTIDAELKKNWDSVNVFVTRDFVNVIIAQNPSDSLNNFLRTPNWIAAFGAGKEPVLLLLSPFEVNRLIPIIKQIKGSATLRMFAPRLIPKQQTLLNSKQLTIRNGIDNDRSFFEIPKHLLPPLFVFSGTLYFLNEEEQSSYSTFLGILPLNDRNTLEEAAAIEGKIDRGFLPPDHRQQVSPLINLLCGFLNHPENIIREIIETRHGFWPEASHVSKLVLDCRKVDKFDD